MAAKWTRFGSRSCHAENEEYKRRPPHRNQALTVREVPSVIRLGASRSLRHAAMHPPDAPVGADVEVRDTREEYGDLHTASSRLRRCTTPLRPRLVRCGDFEIASEVFAVRYLLVTSLPSRRRAAG
jgi:hypothetical protein